MGLGWQDVQGWFDYQAIYAEAVRRLPPAGGVVVEVGSWLGKSLLYLCEALKAAGKTADVYAVDHGIGIPEDYGHQGDLQAHGGTLAGLLVSNLQAAGHLDLVTPIVCLSLKAPRLFRPGSVDFCWIDTGHTYEGTRAEIAAYLPLVRPGGLIGGHDYREASALEPNLGVVPAVNEAFRPDRIRDRAYTDWEVPCPGSWCVKV